MQRMLFAALAALTVACTPPAQAPDLRALAEGETRIDGVVSQIEDGPYPQYTIILQPDGGEAVSLYLNAEGGADLGGQTASDFAGQTVVAYYTTADDPVLTDVQTPAGVSLLPADSAAVQGAETIAGTLSGADAVTQSDLPDTVTITDAQGTAHTFEFYIPEAMVAANGQQVVAHYRPGVRHAITLLRATETP